MFPFYISSFHRKLDFHFFFLRPNFSSFAILGAFLICLSGTRATPTLLLHHQMTASTTALSSAQIASFRPYAFYASASYCRPSEILSWTCGVNCNENPTFHPIAAGGDGVDVQFWYVGFDPTLQTVIVAHQGTDASKVEPLITDADFFLEHLDSRLFPGVSSYMKVHNGFAAEQAKTAASVLLAVRAALQMSRLDQVTIIGHSLGAAIALLDGVSLSLTVPNTHFNVIGYGMPRVGNQAFASYVDNHLSVTRVNNKKDFVPILPGIFFGFHHPQGEKHIQDDDSWIACSGDDNPDFRCTTGDILTILQGKLSDHFGPYDGVTIGC